MADLAPSKRYAVILAVIRQRLAVVTDDLCDVFCKQMRRVSRSAGEELQKYLDDNQGKTDEILRCYTLINTALNSAESSENQLQTVRNTVSARPGLCEFSRLHAEYGGKNECRFMAPIFAHRRGELLRILSKRAWVPEKWWKLITGDQQREAATRLNRRQFEVCVCMQLVRELKSADFCVMGANNYSDTRDELVLLDECAKTREACGQVAGHYTH